MSNGDQEKSYQLWSPKEDEILREYVKKHGEHEWNEFKKRTGINRDAKRCYKRWEKHLKPGLSKGPMTDEEERLIVKLHAELGNQWAKIAKQLPGRTNIAVMNYWKVRTARLEREGLPIYPPQVSQQIQNDSQDVGALPTTSKLTPSQLPGSTNYDIRKLRTERLEHDGSSSHPPQVTQQIQNDSQDVGPPPTTSQVIPSQAVRDGDLDYYRYFFGDDDVDDLSDFSGDDDLEEGKKSAKKKESVKSCVVLEVKPWDNETNMNQLKVVVRSVDMPGLTWGASKVVRVGDGIPKLQIKMNLVEGLVSEDTVIEEILTAEPCRKYVQSCEIVNNI